MRRQAAGRVINLRPTSCAGGVARRARESWLLAAALFISVCVLMAALAATASAAGGHHGHHGHGKPHGKPKPHPTFDISVFSVVPSTTQAGGHPDLTITIKPKSPRKGDIKNLVLDLPPGLVGDPDAVSQKCSASDFAASTQQGNNCDPASQVGTVKVMVSVLGFSIPVSGRIYVMEPEPTQAGKLGFLLVSPFPGVIPHARVIDEITVRPDGGLSNKILMLPRSVKVFGFYDVNITIESIVATLNGKAPSGENFITNPVSCSPATSKLKATSYAGEVVNKASTFTPTGCTGGGDTTLPVVTISTPTAGQVLTTNSASVAFTATDNVGVVSTTCALAGPTPSAAAACTSPKLYSGLANGTYTATVSAQDAAGNTGTATRAFSVNVPAGDTTDPVVSISAPTADQVLTTNSASLEFTATDDVGVVSTT
ncbi:MAG: hypothetical protein WAP35_11175, partial [Solirubrobacterales bacterium]